MKEKTDFISVIVPVYNKAAYLPKCLESLHNQTYRQIEVLLVDDGSTDASPEICQTFCAKDKRFRYLRQKNAGQNAARLTGINAAQGNWAVFVDADDFVTPDMCASMMQCQRETGADLVMATIQHWTEGKLGRINPIPSGTCTGKESVLHFISKSFFQLCMPGGLCSILYRTQSVKKGLQTIDLRITFSEDTGCILSILLETKRVAFMPQVVYYYRQIPESYSHAHDKSNVLTQKWLLQHLRSLFARHGISKEAGWIADWLILRDLLLGGYESFNDYAGLYPFFRGQCGGRIAVYGAGRLGEELVTKLKDFTIVGWFDRDWQRYRALGRDVDAPAKLATCACDAVIVAIQDPDVAAHVRQELLASLPVNMQVYTIAQDIIESDYSMRKLADLLYLEEG